MPAKTFHILWIAAAVACLTGPAPAFAQASDTTSSEESETFKRRYIDAQARRASRVMLLDWPELTRLLAWTRGLEAAVAVEDSTLSAERVDEFRARIDTLAAGPVPEFLTSRRDSVKATLALIQARLEGAQEALEAAPPAVRAEEGAAANAAEKKRTLVTGETAVTVPAGVAVGDRDTLPRATIDGEAVNYLDYVALALADLDRLVHVVRKVGREDVSEPPSPAEPARSPRTGEPRRER